MLFTGDEETGGNGARRAASEWRSLIDAEYALECDGGGGALYKDGRVDGFCLQIAEKTYADYQLTAPNRGGHSSRAASGQCDLCARRGAIERLEEHRFEPMINDATRAFFDQPWRRTTRRLRAS